MTRPRTVIALTLSLAAVAAPAAFSDSPQSKPAAPATATAPSQAEPEHIQVQHILIAFTGTLPGKNVTRTAEEARKLAYELVERTRKGEDFDALVKHHTDDQHPGIYGMANLGVTPGTGEFRRNGMVRAFGDVGFKLKVGEVGVADFDKTASPYGYHVIKRTK